MKGAEMQKLLDFCAAADVSISPQTQEIADLRLRGTSWEEICRRLGLSRGNATTNLRRLKLRAIERGFNPDAVHQTPIEEGYRVKGKSRLVAHTATGAETRLEWVKTETDKERQARILIEALENASKTNKPFKPTKGPSRANEDLATLVTITDFHLGMLAWEDETGEAWDTQIARDVLLNAVHDLIQGSPKSGLGILNQLGDFLHFDSILGPTTPTSNFVLDADTRYSRLVELTITLMQEVVRMMLKAYPEVRVIQAEGNHDISGSVWIRKHLKHMFSDEPRVTVDDTEFPYYAHLHGRTMLAFHHGHKMKLSQVHKLFASEPRYRPMWGEATRCYIHTGHLHHERVIEDGGAIAEQHPTLASRDAYAVRGGWVSQSGAKAITYDKTDGEVHRITVRPRRA